MKTKTIALVAMLLSGMALANHHEGHGHGHAEKKIHMHGAIDLNYTYNFNEVQSESADTFEHDNFTTGLVEMNFSGSMKSLDWYIDLAYGGQAKILAAPISATNSIVAQAYLTHNLSDDLSITAGRMFTNNGFEGSYNKDNWNYSKSWAYQASGLYAHDGVAVKYASENGFGASFFVYDGSSTPLSIDDNSDGKAISAQLSYATEMFGAVYNFYNDKDGVENYHNLNLTADFSPAISTAASVFMSEDMRSGGDSELFGWALYAKFNASKHVYIAPRFEMVNIESGGVEDTITGATLTLGYDCEKSGQYRIEGRYDSSDYAIFAKKGSTGEDNTMKVTAAWMYSF